MALSFSPTVYASSMRVLFIYDLMQVITISSLLSGLIKRYNQGGIAPHKIQISTCNSGEIFKNCTSSYDPPRSAYKSLGSARYWWI